MMNWTIFWCLSSVLLILCILIGWTSDVALTKGIVRGRRITPHAGFLDENGILIGTYTIPSVKDIPQYIVHLDAPADSILKLFGIDYGCMLHGTIFDYDSNFIYVVSVGHYDDTAQIYAVLHLDLQDIFNAVMLRCKTVVIDKHWRQDILYQYYNVVIEVQMQNSKY